MSLSRAALNDLFVDVRETRTGDDTATLAGRMRFGKALEGPPGRLHGGYHAHVRTLPLLERCSLHDPAQTYPCAVDVHIQQALLLDEDTPFDARYERHPTGWSLRTRFADSERLCATARSLPDEPLLSRGELEHYKTLFQASQPPAGHFKMFGVTVQLGSQVVYVAGQDPARTQPGSQLADLCDAEGAFGPALIAAQLDAVGAVAQGTRMRHPHFTKRIELAYASGRVSPEQGFVFVSDRTRIEDDAQSRSKSVVIQGQAWGTVRVRVALLDADFERALAVGTVTVHPVDPEKFAPLAQMRKLRDDHAT